MGGFSFQRAKRGVAQVVVAFTILWIHVSAGLSWEEAKRLDTVALIDMSAKEICDTNHPLLHLNSIMSKRRRLCYDTPAGTHRQVLSFDSMISPAEDAPMNSFVDTVSLDGRRVHRTKVPIGAPASPVKLARREQLQQTTSHPTTSHPNPLSLLTKPLVVEQESYQMALWLDGATPATLLPEELSMNLDPFESGNASVDPAV
uniref:Transmembrane protein n=1 Tax=Mycena chlorophos TaxID=658473 RepID=A0ABQ0L1C2_MYCCL|nr:predicted protein [Mycena chlorophos]